MAATHFWIRAALAAAFTAVVEFCSALATALWGHMGLHNLGWLIGIPTVIALITFKSAESRMSGVLGLIVVAFASWMAAGYFLPDY